MKASIIGSGLLVATLTTLFFISNNAVSENVAASQALPQTQTKAASLEANHPLAVAHQQLKQAQQDFSSGNMDAVQKSLTAASKSLQHSKISNKTKAEASKLADEIQQLQKQLDHPSTENENIITQFWNRSSELLGQEIELVTKSWNDSSIASQTMKLLVDARLYFTHAEHDIFINHNPEKATEEVKNTLKYLDKAYEIAIPRVRKEIASIKKDIQQLPTSHINAAEDKAIILALDTASISIEKSSHSLNPEIQARSKFISKEIMSLKKDIFFLEKRQQYDSIMKRLHNLDVLL